MTLIEQLLDLRGANEHVRRIPTSTKPQLKDLTAVSMGARGAEGVLTTSHDAGRRNLQCQRGHVRAQSKGLKRS